MNNIILIFFLLFSFQAMAKTECAEVEYKYSKNKKIKKDSASLCSKNNGKFKLIFSKNCLKGKCVALSKLKEYKAPRKHFLKREDIGSPHFGKCHMMGGFPYRVKMNRLLTDRKTMLCFFSEDNSILNTESLYKWID